MIRRVRLARTRWPGEVAGSGWGRGTNLDYLRRVVARWQRFDWRAAQAGLNELPHYRATIDGTAVHFVRVPQGPTPLLLVHGWPSTFYEFTKILPLLTGFDVVAPSLPGYGFSDRLQPSANFNRVPELLTRLMTDVLGHERFVTHGDDIGAMVSNRIAVEFGEQVAGVHVTFPPEPLFGPGTPPPSAAEQAILDRRPATSYWGTGYAHIAATRPQTLAYALSDSPAGLAAWMIDKMRDWADCDGDLSRRFTGDELLTWITLYWVTGTAGSALDPYHDWALASAGMPVAWEGRDVPGGVDSRPLPLSERIEVPAGVTVFGRSPLHPPREWAERSYADLRRFSVLPRGGHFAAWEEPELLADELREFVAGLDGSKVQTRRRSAAQRDSS